MTSKYILHIQWSRSDAINSSILVNFSILLSISPLRNGVLYLQHYKQLQTELVGYTYHSISFTGNEAITKLQKKYEIDNYFAVFI